MAGYDPNQPRDKTGKWTDTGAGAVAAARKAAGLPSVSPAAEDACTRFARVYNRAPVEHCEIIDPITGEVIYEAVGNEYSVDLNPFMVGVQYGDYPEPDNMILTHNHPKPFPHSHADIWTAAEMGLGEVRVAYWGQDGLTEHIVRLNDQSRANVLDTSPFYMLNLYTQLVRLAEREIVGDRFFHGLEMPDELREQVVTLALQSLVKHFDLDYEMRIK